MIYSLKQQQKRIYSMKKLQSTVSKKNSLNHHSGFTLIEVLVGITILTIGLLGVAKMQISAIQGNSMSSCTSAALSLAEEKMERIMVTNFNDTVLADTETGNNNNLTSITTIDHQEVYGGAPINIDETGGLNAQGRYRRIWNIANHPSGFENLPTMKSVTVIVTWENDKHRVFLSSIKPQ
jgi:prepilin-type N-terminal cleavage/methylation domain-containing protein